MLKHASILLYSTLRYLVYTIFHSLLTSPSLHKLVITLPLTNWSILITNLSLINIGMFLFKKPKWIAEMVKIRHQIQICVPIRTHGSKHRSPYPTHLVISMCSVHWRRQSHHIRTQAYTTAISKCMILSERFPLCLLTESGLTKSGVLAIYECCEGVQHVYLIHRRMY